MPNNNNNNQKSKTNADVSKQIKQLTDRIDYLTVKLQAKQDFRKIKKYEISDNLDFGVAKAYETEYVALIMELHAKCKLMNELKQKHDKVKSSNINNNQFKLPNIFAKKSGANVDKESLASEKYHAVSELIINHLDFNDQKTEISKLAQTSHFWNQARVMLNKQHQWIVKAKPSIEKAKENLKSLLSYDEEHHSTCLKLPSSSTIKYNVDNDHLENQYWVLVYLDRLSTGTISNKQINFLSAHQVHLTKELCNKLSELYPSKFSAIIAVEDVDANTTETTPKPF